jgi:hypothetical protein
VVWFGLFATMAWVGTQENRSGLPLLVSCVFGLTACHFAFGLPLVRYLKLGRTTHLVTDRRIIARTSFLGGKERSTYLTKLSPPLVRPAADGTGTITFGELTLFALLRAGHGMPASRGSREPAMLLVGVEDPTRVRDLIATAISAARRRTTA